MKKGRRIKWTACVLAMLFAISLVNGNINKLLFASGGDERIVFAYGKTMAEHQEIAIFVNEEQATMMEITTPTQDVNKLPIRADMKYEISTNGVYLFRLLDKDGKEIVKVEQDFSNLKKLDIIEKEKEWEIISRSTSVSQVETACGDNKEVIALTNDGHGNSYAMMAIPEVGSCRFTPLDQSGVQVGTVFEYTKKSKVNESNTTAVPLKKQVNNAKDLHLIVEQPDGIYEVTADIDMTDMKTLDIIFSGTLLGNGFQLYNMKQPLFLKMDQAEVSNLHLQGDLESEQNSASFALQGNSTKINGSSFQGSIVSEKEAAGFIVSGNNVIIENSYVSAKIESKTTGAGFMNSGSGQVRESFVSGVIKGEENSYGFGKEIEGSKSYVAANILGANSNMFNKEKAIEDCFYDESLNDFEEERATAYSNMAITSKNLDIKESFTITEGKYPQIKEEITENWSEKSKEVAKLSVFSLPLTAHENMATLEAPLNLPTTMDEESIEWNENGDAKAEIISVDEQSEEIEETILSAKTKEGTRYFATRNAQLLASNDIIVGERTAVSTTTISFNATDGYYYKVVDGSEVVSEVNNHKDAIDAGFKKKIGTGIYNVGKLKWNTTYTVYETDLATMSSRVAKTNFGLLGGNINVSGTVKVGETLQADLQDTTTTTGIWTWYKSQLMDSGWTQIVDATSDSLTLKEDDLGYYIKTVFTTDPTTNVQDAVEYIQDIIVKQDLSVSSTISIIGNAEIGGKLSIGFESGVNKDDFNIQWYQKSSGSEDVKIGSGLQHDIVKDDIGKQLYAIATTKAESYFIGSITSDLTPTVVALAMVAPTERPAAVAGTIEDTTVRMQMPANVKDGLYRFGYQVSGGEIIEFPITVRGSNSLTITGLTPGLTYTFRAKRIGENGYLDSAWGTLTRNFSMGDKYITGYLDLTGNAVFGETLKGQFITDALDQVTETKWYRIKDGVRESSAIATGDTYVLKAEDVGCKIEVETAGINGYAGFVRAFSETIVRAFVLSPTANVTEQSINSNAIQIQLPKLDMGMSSTEDKFIIGISDSESGYPIEYNAGSGVEVYTESAIVDLIGLKPETTYYIYLRYAMTGSHYQSEWSTNKRASKTIQEIFTGTINFSYPVNVDAIQGEKISAKVTSTNDGFEYEGIWQWYRILPDTSEEKISNFYAETDEDGNELKNETFFNVPKSELVGTKYRVVYMPDNRYTGTATSTSNLVQAPIKEAYDAPSKPDEVSDTDAMITVKMPSNLEGIYQFGYSLKADGSDIIEVETTALAGAEVVINGLIRNTTYYVYSRRNGDENKSTSSWSTSNLQVKTKLTNISGYISLEENVNYGTQLTATYNGASYAPVGDDSKGTYQWYRDNIAIDSATSNTYTPVQADIGTILKVNYTANATQGFQGSKNASTKEVRKAIQSNPNKVVISGAASLGSKPGMNVKFHPSDTVFYRLQKASEAAPGVPLNSTEISSAKWKPSPKEATDLYADYEGTTLLSNIDYILYVVKVETTTAQASSVVASDAMSTSSLAITGNIAITGNAVVGQKLTATLMNSNNTSGKGTWKWYRSKQAYPAVTSMPSLTDETKWTQAASGYHPTLDSTTSTYNLTTDDFGYYMKVEFVSNEIAGFKGSMQVGNTYSKKVFEEKVSIEGKGYPGETITIKLEGSRAVDELTTKKIRIMNGNTKIAEYEGTKVDGQTFNATIPNNTTTQGYPDGYKVIGVINVPDTNLYVKDDGGTFTGTESLTDTLTYKSGIPISNENDMKSFIMGTGDYASRTAKYIITNNINMSGIGTIVMSTVQFTGILDGDNHYVTNLSNPVFNKVSKSTIKNLIINLQNVSYSTISEANVASSLSRESYGGNTFSRVFLSQAVIVSGHDAGYLIGKSFGSPTFESDSYIESGSVGGEVSSLGTNKVVSGLLGYSEAHIATYMTDCLSIGTKIKGIGTQITSGLVTNGGGGTVTVKNAIIASVLVQESGTSVSRSGVSSNYKGFGATPSITNGFYDKTLNSFTQYQYGQGEGLSTADLIGNKLETKFNSAAWNYKDGFYPRLKWLGENPIQNLFAATRGAFKSIDGNTSSAGLFNGTISGTIQVPEELRINGFSISSSNPSILKVGANGIITPLKSGPATITIVYTEPDAKIGGSATNTFNFTTTSSMSSYDSVTLSGTPGVGNRYVSSVLPSAAASGSNYQWYRKKVGTLNDTATSISNALSANYTPTASDIGYQLQLKVSKSGYGTSLSNWSDPVVISAPTATPTISLITDSGFVITGQGSTSSDYEYAYADTAVGGKTLVTNKGASVTMLGMQRNKEYYIFSRIAGGTGYPASEWSTSVKATTLKTDLEGAIQVVSTYNVGSNLTASIPDTNLQEGTWEIQRVDGSTNTNVTSLATTNSTYQVIYPLTSADVGKQLKILYTGKNDFQNELLLNRTNIIKNQAQSAPSEPTISAKTDSSFSVEMAIPESGSTYSFGYRRFLSDEITPVSGSGTTATFNGLIRNTNYYIYAKKNVKSGFEESDWGPAILASTDRTNLSGNITQSGNEQTEGTLVFTAPSSKGETGRWNLERFNMTEITTLDTYTISPDGSVLTYKVIPDDAGNRLRATFNGMLDFQSTLSIETKTVLTKEQDALTTQPVIVSSSEYYLEPIMNSGIDMFQFGYRELDDTGTIQLFPATTTVGKSAIITGLQRNTEYEIYVRKAAKAGYDAGDWNTTPVIGKTTTSPLNGNISFTGNAIVGESVKASFDTNGYPQSGDDSKGTWSWLLDGVQLSETSDTLTIPSFASGNPELRVVYNANIADGFQGSVTRTIGKAKKNSFAVTNIPTVTALVEDGEKGSKIKVANTDIDDVYYYVQSSDLNTEPTVVLASEATTTLAMDVWVKATPDMNFNLEPNKGYQVFAARLETVTKGVSGIVTGKSIRTVKEELLAPVVDQDVSITWKADQKRTLYHTQYDEAPKGTWSLFMTNDLAGEWQNIDAQVFNVKQGVDDNQAYVTFEIPMKFTGNYIKAVFTGAEDFIGKQEYVSRSIDDVDTEGKLIGQTMLGHVEILNPDTNELLVPIDVQYVGNDEKSGIWTWYRETAENSDVYEMIPGVTNTGVTSSYTPTATDFNRNIYAVYSANPRGLYSGKQQSNNIKQVKRSGQNKPEKVTIKKVNGTRILVSPPSNFKSDIDGTMPQVVLGYKEAKDKNDVDAPITWQLSANYGNNWFNNLKVNTAYVIYAKFLGTPTYDVSLVSDASDEAVTMNQNFINASYKLKKNHDLADTYIMDVGNSITATYSDEGWDEGYFRIKRSNGDIIIDKVNADVSVANQASYTYAYQTEDIGTHIIMEYVAKDDAIFHSGSIVTATPEPVTKPIDQSMPIAPILTSSDHTTLVLDAVNTQYEYVLSQSLTPPDMNSGEWDKLPAVDGSAYDFSDVRSQNAYYIHVRIAETAIASAGDKTATAGPFKVEGPIDLGTITLNNVEDEVTLPTGTSTSVILPNILLGDILTIKNVNMTRNGVEVTYPQTSVNEFVNGNKPHENVFAKGSDWGDQHFASDIQVVNDAGTVVSSSKGNGTSLSSVSPTTSIQLQMYRVNAMKESGTYAWTCDLEDVDGNVASYKAEIKVETQIKAMIPIKLDMYIRDGYINQTSNAEVLVNDGMMPLNYQMDEYAEPGKLAMPALLGIFNKPLAELGKNEVYLKVSSDGSNFTKEKGIWIRTNGASNPQGLALLGAKSKAGYLISGISDKTMNWPWESEENRVIPEAYKFHFIVDVSNEDVDMKQSVSQP